MPDTENNTIADIIKGVDKVFIDYPAGPLQELTAKQKKELIANLESFLNSIKK